MKGLLLASDPGRELSWPSVRPHVVQLAPLVNKPIALHGFEQLRSAGATQIAVVVSQATADALQDMLGDGSRFRTEISYVEQPESRGLFGALSSIADFAAGDDVMVHPSDVVVALAARQLVADFHGRSLDALMVVAPEEGGRAGAADFTGLSVFGPRGLAGAAALAAARPNATLADLFRRLSDDGRRVETRRTYAWSRLRPDQSSLLYASRLALESIIPGDLEGRRLSGRDVSVHGPAMIDPSAVVEASTLRGPVVVGPRAEIRHAFIGPCTCIGAGVVIEGAEIENSVVLDDVVIRHVPQRMDSSILGPGARVHCDLGLPRGLRLQLGERSEVVLS